MKYYIDLGSSTIKVYCYEEVLTLKEERSIHFKDGFDSNVGFSKINDAEVIKYFKELKEKYNFEYERVFIYATGMFRKMDSMVQDKYIKLFNDELDLHLTVLSHGLENYYLGKALESDYNRKKVMIINMGGKTTELVTFENNIITKRHNLDIGVVDILNEFSDINEEIAKCKIEDINDFILQKIENIDLDNDYDCAIFTGGEERFEKLTNYNLVPNTLFDDNIHKYMVSYDDYIKQTSEVFYSEKYTLTKLHELMPGNPKWMDGARAGAVLPINLFIKGNIKYIIPSDLNLINGVIKDK